MGASQLPQDVQQSDTIAVQNDAPSSPALYDLWVDADAVPVSGTTVSFSREGGSATNWTTPGTTTQTISGTPKIQTGAIQSGSIATGSSESIAVTFPVAYTYPPQVFCQYANTTGVSNMFVRADSITTTGFNIVFINTAAVTGTAQGNWMAIGETA